MKNDEQSEQFWRERLLALRQELEDLDDGTATARKAVELDQSRVGRLSRMDALQGQAMNNAIAKRRRQTLVRISAALARLDEGEFGYCALCGDHISKKRLDLDPTVATCINCKQ